MNTTYATIAEAATTTDPVATANSLGALWLTHKEAEREGEKAKKARTAIGEELHSLVGKDAVVNPHGNRRYRVAVTYRENASHKVVIDALIARHPHLAEEVETLTQASKSTSVSVALKPVKD